MANIKLFLTISTAVLAHAITSSHELQHGVKVAADSLKAASERIHSPLLIFLLCAIRSLARRRRWWCRRVLGLLAEGAVGQQAEEEQERSETGPTGHPVSQTAQCDRRMSGTEAETQTRSR